MSFIAGIEIKIRKGILPYKGSILLQREHRIHTLTKRGIITVSLTRTSILT